MKIQRNFIIGSNWLYFKIYTGYKTADFLLTEIIYPIVQNLQHQNIISHWFFIRYNDPDFHIRVRFFIPKIQDIDKIIFVLNKSLSAFLEDDLIWDIQFDTYKRELERYGEKTMEISELIFYYDSEFTINLIKIAKTNNIENKIWLYLLKSIDTLLSDFEYNTNSKFLLMKDLQTSFYFEFNINKDDDWQFGQNYRTFRKEIEQILYDNNSEKNALLNLSLRKSEQIKECVSNLLNLKNNNNLEIEIKDLLMSYIHMSINRAFRSQPRKYELILYDFLYKYYNSLLKRNNKQISDNNILSNVTN